MSSPSKAEKYEWIRITKLTGGYLVEMKHPGNSEKNQGKKMVASDLNALFKLLTMHL